MALGNLIPWGRTERTLPTTSGQSPLFSLHREMDRLFDEALRQFDMPTGWNRRWPMLEVEDTDQGYLVRAELPGMDENDIDLSFKDGLLVIRGEKRFETQNKERTVSERYYGQFERQIALPDVDEAKVTASFDRGILSVTLPRSEGAKVHHRRIPINGRSTRH